MGKIVGAYILPHPPIMIEEIGGKESQKVLHTIKALQKVSERIAIQSPDTIIIITPHGSMFGDAMNLAMEEILAGNFGRFGAPGLKYRFENDVGLADKIIDEADKEGVYCIPFTKEMAKTYRTGYELDHGALVPLHFIEKNNKNVKLVHITYSGLPIADHYKLGMAIKKSVDSSDRNVVIIASGDLSHRLTFDAPAGYDERGKEYDKYYLDIVKKGDVNTFLSIDKEFIEAAGECAYRSTAVLFGCFDKCEIKGEILSYEGPFGVGYGVAEIYRTGGGEAESCLDRFTKNETDELNNIRKNEDSYVKLARMTLENRIRFGKKTEIPDDLPQDMLEKRAGVFVSLKKGGELRGCIGTIRPTAKNVAIEIMQNTVSAGLRDTRFFPVEEDELAHLVYSVDVLGDAEKINSKDNLDPKRYGVIVRKGFRTGLLLPNLEGVNTIEDQLNIALKKAGIDENEDFELERFEVIRHY